MLSPPSFAPSSPSLLPLIPFTPISYRLQRNEVSDFHASTFAVPTIMQVLRLIRTYRADSPTPALDHVWKTKGLAGTKADLEAYWDEDRKKPETEREVDENEM